jgi:hypothetical protein
MPKPKALLLAMLDSDHPDEDVFNRWYDEKHIPERLACPGVLSVRRFQAIEGSPRYLTVYELIGPEALQSPEYLALASNASDETRAMVASMKSLIRNVYIEIGERRLGGSR